MKLFSSPQAGAHVIATIVVLGFVIFVAVLAMHIVQETTLLIAMGGGLMTAFQNVVGYYMGSSMGSAQKTAQISHLIGQAADAAAAPAKSGA